MPLNVVLTVAQIFARSVPLVLKFPKSIIQHYNLLAGIEICCNLAFSIYG